MSDMGYLRAPFCWGQWGIQKPSILEGRIAAACFGMFPEPSHAVVTVLSSLNILLYMVYRFEGYINET